MSQTSLSKGRAPINKFLIDVAYAHLTTTILTRTQFTVLNIVVIRSTPRSMLSSAVISIRFSVMYTLCQHNSAQVSHDAPLDCVFNFILPSFIATV